MNKDEIFIKLKPIIAERLGREESEVNLTAHLHNDLAADSLDAVELVMEIEKQLNLVIPDKEAETFTDVQSVVDWVFKHQDTPAPSSVQA